MALVFEHPPPGLSSEERWEQSSEACCAAGGAQQHAEVQSRLCRGGETHRPNFHYHCYETCLKCINHKEFQGKCHQLSGLLYLCSITWTTWTAWESRTSSSPPTVSFITSTASSCPEMRGRATGTRATVEVSATLLLTWRACTVASVTSKFTWWWSSWFMDKFLSKEWMNGVLPPPPVSRLIWLCRRPSVSPRSPMTTCACSTVW